MEINTKKILERKQSRVLNGKEIKHQTDNPTKKCKMYEIVKSF